MVDNLGHMKVIYSNLIFTDRVLKTIDTLNFRTIQKCTKPEKKKKLVEIDSV